MIMKARELLKEANIGDEFEIEDEENAKVIRSSDITAEDLERAFFCSADDVKKKRCQYKQ